MNLTCPICHKSTYLDSIKIEPQFTCTRCCAPIRIVRNAHYWNLVLCILLVWLIPIPLITFLFLIPILWIGPKFLTFKQR